MRNRDVIDARGSTGRSGGLGGGGFPLPLGRAGGGIGVVGLLVYLAIQFLSSSGGGGGFDVGRAFGPQVSAPGAAQGIPPSEDPQRDLKDFSSYVFTDVQRTWEKTFQQTAKPYDHAKLLLYSGAVDTGCGAATSAAGPFYCPGDGRVYLDLSFYQDMSSQLGAPGDFAWAYVIAHEMGHHVQDEIGTSDEVHSQEQSNPGDANALSVRLELQADCYAGVWANTAFKQGEVQAGDISEAVNASAAVGDDRLQRQATGTINPDSFTHGTSEQRSHWFRAGYRSGDPAVCDTFSAEHL